MELQVMNKLNDAAFFADLAARVAAEWITRGIVFNPTRESHRLDPYPFYHRLRAKDPIHRSFPAGGWVLSRYDDIFGVLSDRTFSSDERNWNRHESVRAHQARGGLPDPYADQLASMLRQDPPVHTRLRTLVAKAFTPRAVEQMRPRIQATVDAIVDQLAGGGEFDLIRDFASPLPVVIIGEMLGVDVVDSERFRHWSNEVTGLVGDSTRDERRRARVSLDEMRAWLEVQIESRRREPRGDLLSGMVTAEEQGDRLTTAELFSTCTLLLIAGNETTTNLIGNGVIALLRNPEQLEILRADPSLVPAAVEEMLRYDSPVQLTSRMVLEDRDLRGQPVRRGEQLVLLLGAGNRDPERFPEPDRFDVRRPDVRPLSFGHGLHYCLGAQLARLEAQIAFDAIVRRLPGLRFGAGEIIWGRNTVLRGPRVLPVAA